jgi:hypothetical protein
MCTQSLPGADPGTDTHQGAVDAPVKSGCQFDAYTYLTDDQYDLFDRMSEISEEGWCASWLCDNEYKIWDAIALTQLESGYRYVNPRLLRRCKKLSDEIGGWIYWTKDGPQFAPMTQWLAMVDARRNADRNLAAVT